MQKSEQLRKRLFSKLKEIFPHKSDDELQAAIIECEFEETKLDQWISMAAGLGVSDFPADFDLDTNSIYPEIREP